ncbi:hypothetical protein [Streptosporangium canum]|uniref:hypothetical protein n=1 Tax=Streptosporangium canum TaxID=324952 RepID=UPI0037B116BE
MKGRLPENPDKRATFLTNVERVRRHPKVQRAIQESNERAARRAAGGPQQSGRRLDEVLTELEKKSQS